jgi:hypothetical protein
MAFSIMTECCCAECHYAECLYAEGREYALCAECHYAECRYAVCHGALSEDLALPTVARSGL